VYSQSGGSKKEEAEPIESLFHVPQLTHLRTFFLVLVALIGVTVVIAPVTHADPAEFITADGASHVIAALVLFNPSRALGTPLRVD
jgi:hypothetical protein